MISMDKFALKIEMEFVMNENLNRLCKDFGG